MYLKMTCSITLSSLGFKYKATSINYYGPVGLKMSYLKNRKLSSGRSDEVWSLPSSVLYYITSQPGDFLFSQGNVVT